MKKLTPDYFRSSKWLKFWYSLYAEMLHEGTHQIFRAWLTKDWVRVSDIKTLHLKNRYDPEEYVDKFIDEFESNAVNI